MKETTERFVRVFEDLKAEVNKRAGKPESHSFEISEAAHKDKTVRRQVELLRYIRDVRNALQHPKHRTAGHAITVTPQFLTEVEALVDRLRNPPTATSIGVARKDMMTARLTDELGALADEMKRTGFSHLPILDEKDVLIGVFNEAAVFDYLWREDAQIIERSMTVQDVLAHCKLDAGHTETFRFVLPGTSLDELIDLFRAVATPMTRVGAVFVTPSGKSEQPIHRLITPWDVLGDGSD